VLVVFPISMLRRLSNLRWVAFFNFLVVL